MSITQRLVTDENSRKQNQNLQINTTHNRILKPPSKINFKSQIT